MLNINVKHNKSRAKSGHSPWCVDTRSVLPGGSRKFYRTKEEALHAIAHLNKENTSASKSSTQTWKWNFQELADDYLALVKTEHLEGERSYSDEIDKIRFIKTFLEYEVEGAPVAQMRVADMASHHLQFEVMNQMKANRSKSTVQNHYSAIKQMFRHAVLKQCRDTLPFEIVKAKGEKKKANLKSAYQAKKIAFSVIAKIVEHSNDEWALAIMFAATTGLRQGEQRALTWGCLDLENSKVYVTRAAKHRTAGFKDPKTVAGSRKVDLTREICQLLKERYMKFGRPNPNDLVFGSQNGSMKRGFKFWENLQKACDRAGVERIRWHDLRHHFASQCMAEFCETKDDLWKVTKLMGHTKIAMTQERYGHWFDEEGENTEDVDRLSARMTFNRKDQIKLV